MPATFTFSFDLAHDYKLFSDYPSLRILHDQIGPLLEIEDYASCMFKIRSLIEEMVVLWLKKNGAKLNWNNIELVKSINLLPNYGVPKFITHKLHSIRTEANFGVHQQGNGWINAESVEKVLLDFKAVLDWYEAENNTKAKIPTGRKIGLNKKDKKNDETAFFKYKPALLISLSLLLILLTFIGYNYHQDQLKKEGTMVYVCGNSRIYHTSPKHRALVKNCKSEIHEMTIQKALDQHLRECKCLDK